MLVVAIVAATACNKSSDKIKVGHYASMTGSEATFGVSTDQGIRLAAEERNKAGGVKGKQVDIITGDTASKATEGGTVVTRLITQDNVVALLGEVASSITLAGGDVAQKLGVPDITPSSTNVRVTDLGDMVSRVCFTDDFQAWVVAKFVRDNLKFDKAAILYDQGQAYSKGFAEFFNKSFTAMGGEIVANEAYSGGNPDASAQLQTIKGSGAQIIFLPGYYGDAANFMKQAKSKGIEIPFIGGDGWDSEDLIKIAGAAANGNYFSNHYSHEEKRKEVQDFVAAYKAKYGKVPDGLAALGYDAARVLFDAMDRAGSLEGKALGAAIAATKDFKGVTGNITMDAKRNAQKKAVILKIENGAPHLVTDIWPEGTGPAEKAPAPEKKPADGSGSADAAPEKK
ncbi:MAG: ABC transporter substrate-binding protein [Deltaproteobacteria bacterium]|nr:ABC transporter substrate-binding protein [Deltaproteobacteria bacterium]